MYLQLQEIFLKEFRSNKLNLWYLIISQLFRSKLTFSCGIIELLIISYLFTNDFINEINAGRWLPILSPFTLTSLLKIQPMSQNGGHVILLKMHCQNDNAFLTVLHVRHFGILAVFLIMTSPWKASIRLHNIVGS